LNERLHKWAERPERKRDKTILRSNAREGGWLHAAILRFVFVKRALVNAVAPAQVRRLLACFLLLEHLNNLLVRKSLLYLSVLWLGGLYIILEEF